MVGFRVDGHILFILDHESSGRVTNDSHQLQTKAINHSTRHYMNRRELQSDQPIHVPLLRVVSLPHSACIVAIPSNHKQRYASCNCSELAATRIHRDDLYRQNRVRSRSSGDPQHRSPVYIRYGLFGRAHCVG